MSKLIESKIKSAINNNLNVLMWGPHGIGKSTMYLNAVRDLGLSYKYFSVPTMEPWVDLVGIPVRETKEVKGKPIDYIKLVRPLELAEDNVQVLIFDEINRGDAKIRNAIMEIIQFKSINGHKFNNLKCVLAAANPETEDYDTEELDEALKDRFQIVLDAPTSINKEYFTNKYSEDAAEAVIEYYKNMDVKIRKNLSPRRLDYALDVYYNIGHGLTIHDVLDKKYNPNSLLSYLGHGTIGVILQGFLDDLNKAATEAPTFFRDDDNVKKSIDLVFANDSNAKSLAPFMISANPEQMAKFYSTNKKVKKCLDKLRKLPQGTIIDKFLETYTNNG